MRVLRDVVIERMEHQELVVISQAPAVIGEEMSLELFSGERLHRTEGESARQPARRDRRIDAASSASGGDDAWVRRKLSRTASRSADSPTRPETA